MTLLSPHGLSSAKTQFAWFFAGFRGETDDPDARPRTGTNRETRRCWPNPNAVTAKPGRIPRSGRTSPGRGGWSTFPCLSSAKTSSAGFRPALAEWGNRKTCDHERDQRGIPGHADQTPQPSRPNPAEYHHPDAPLPTGLEDLLFPAALSYAAVFSSRYSWCNPPRTCLATTR